MSDNKTPKNVSPSILLSLMEAGCRVEFPSGYIMTGDLRERYIRLRTPFGPDGVWSMDLQGAKSALLDEKRYKALNQS